MKKIIPDWATELIDSQYDYDRLTGEIHRTTDRNGRRKLTCYLTILLSPGKKKVGITLSNVAWYKEYGVWPEGYIGFKDDNSLNFKIDNLIEQTKEQQSQRQRPHYDKKFKGVSENAKGQIIAQIVKEGQLIYLGAFDTKEEAAKAYDDMAKKLNDGWTRLNFPVSKSNVAKKRKPNKRKKTSRKGRLTLRQP